MALVRCKSAKISRNCRPGSTAGALVPEEKFVEKIVYRPVRRKLPDERRSITHKFSIGGHEGYLTVSSVRL